MNPLDACWAVLKAPVDPKKVAFEEKQRALDAAKKRKAAEEAAAQNQTSLDNWTEGE